MGVLIKLFCLMSFSSFLFVVCDPRGAEVKNLNLYRCILNSIFYHWRHGTLVSQSRLAPASFSAI
eukprot:3235829-Pyramimonas_sp.AAC.1